MKPGIKSSEFWRTLAVQILAILTALGWIDAAPGSGIDQAVGAAVAAITEAAYALSRGFAKQKEPT